MVVKPLVMRLQLSTSRNYLKFIGSIAFAALVLLNVFLLIIPSIFNVSALFEKKVVLSGKLFEDMRSKNIDHALLLNVSNSALGGNGIAEKFAELSLNGIIFFTICNKGMAREWLQQWYISARRVGITNILVIATDTETYDWVQVRVEGYVVHAEELSPLLQSNRWIEKTNSADNSGAFNWRSKGYEQVVVQRATIIKSMLLMTSSDLIYADTDIHWLKNPQNHISHLYSQYHLCLQREKGDELGDYNCSGFMYIKNTELTIKFIAAWEGYIKRRLMKKGFFTDQEEINALLRDIVSGRHSQFMSSSVLQLNACTFDWDDFPSGINYFFTREKAKGKINKTCKSKICGSLTWRRPKKIWEKRDSAYIVHHNFAKSSFEKIARAKKHGLWLELNPSVWDTQITSNLSHNSDI